MTPAYQSIDTRASIEPGAPPPAGSIVVTDSFTVAEGDRLVLKAQPGIKMVVDGAPVTVDLEGEVDVKGGHHSHVFGIRTNRAKTGEADITIGENGTLHVTQGDQGFTWGILAQARTTNFTNHGLLEVGGGAADTTFGAMFTGSHATIENDGVVQVAGTHTTYGLRTDSAGAFLHNAGTVSVTSDQGTAIQMFGGVCVNDGEVDVDGTATGGLVLSNGSQFTNNGVVHAHGAVNTIAVYMLDLKSFHNTGEITASRDGSVGGLTAAGLVFSTAAGGGVVINSGTISGEYSIGTQDIFTGAQATDDKVVNNGLLIGTVGLGGGNDSFNTARGTVQGGIYGGFGDDTIIGSKGADALHGDQDADIGSGSDVLTGGGGADTMDAAGGDNVFRYLKVSDSRAGSADLILDLNSADQIDLQAIDADTGTAGDQAFHLVGSFGHHAGELVVSYDAGADLTTIAGDVNGDGTADLVITASGDHHDFTGFVL